MSFQFVNLTDPSDTKDQKVRRAIRSHVTKQQHQKAEQLAAARRSNSDPQLLGTSSTQIQQGRAHAASFPLSRPATSDQQNSVSPASSSDVGISASSSTAQHPMIDVSQIYPAHWLPYLNQILENCQSSIFLFLVDYVLTCSQYRPSVHCQRSTAIRRCIHDDPLAICVDALCHDRSSIASCCSALRCVALSILYGCTRAGC